MGIIWQAKINDLELVTVIVQKARRHMDACGIPQWDDVYPNEAILRADIDDKHMWIIEVEWRVAGFVTLNTEESPEYEAIEWQYPVNAFVVHRLTIAPEHQRSGLASRLMDFAEEEAVSRGYASVRLDAFTQNPGAVAFYERRGYRKAGTVRFRKGLFFCYEKEFCRE